MKTIYVHRTRSQNDVKEVIVTRAANHRYGNQGETAIFAHEPNKHGRWYIGYGADYIPANKADMANISDIRLVSPDNERGF